MKNRLHIYRVSIVVITAFACGWAASPAGSADVLAAEQAGGPTVDLRTVFLVEPIGRTHRVRIAGELGGKGKVTLDGNMCSVTQFGDPGVCTQIAFPQIDVEIEQVRIADPTGHGRRMYELKGELSPEGHKYFLILPRRRSEAHRLVVDMGRDRRRVITLESGPPPAAFPPVRRPELCRKVAYSAAQASGTVVIRAKGETPSAGYKVRFEQLPIKIFPPQFRLLCVPPSGPAAQVITPFEVQTSFRANKPIKCVFVHDADGKHEVPVRQ